MDLWRPHRVEMPSALIRSLARSRMFVLIATEHAASSAHVAAEVREFLETGGSMIVITAGDISQAVWYPLIAGLPLSQKPRSLPEGGNTVPNIPTRIANLRPHEAEPACALLSRWTSTAAFVIISLRWIVEHSAMRGTRGISGGTRGGNPGSGRDHAGQGYTISQPSSARRQMLPLAGEKSRSGARNRHW